MFAVVDGIDGAFHQIGSLRYDITVTVVSGPIVMFPLAIFIGKKPTPKKNND